MPEQALHLGDRRRGGHRFAVGAGGGHRAEGIATGDDARLDRDLFAGQPVRVATAVEVLVRGADDLADFGKRAAHPVEHRLALDRVAMHDLPLGVVERAGLVDDLLRHRDLADVVKKRRELDVAALVRVEAELVGDGERKLDHAAAVAAGVGVVGLDHIAKQHRRALVGAAQLKRLVDPGLALAGKDGEDRCERHDQQADRRAELDCRERDQQADRRQGAVQRVDRLHQFGEGAGRGAVDETAANCRRREVEGELRQQRGRVDRPVGPLEDLGAGGDQHRGRADRVPAVAEDVEGAIDAGLPGGVVDQPAEGPADADHQRHDRGRQQEEHRHEDQLGWDRVAVGDVELRPAGDDVGGHQEGQLSEVEGAGRGEEQCHSQRHREEGECRDCLN